MIFKIPLYQFIIILDKNIFAKTRYFHPSVYKILEKTGSSSEYRFIPGGHFLFKILLVCPVCHLVIAAVMKDYLFGGLHGGIEDLGIFHRNHLIGKAMEDHDMVQRFCLVGKIIQKVLLEKIQRKVRALVIAYQGYPFYGPGVHGGRAQNSTLNPESRTFKILPGLDTGSTTHTGAKQGYPV